MSNKKQLARMALFVAVVSLIAVTTSSVGSSPTVMEGSSLAKASRAGGFGDGQRSAPMVRERIRADRIDEKVTSLLSRAGIRVGGFLDTSDAETYRELRVNWESFSKSGSPELLSDRQLEARGVLTRKSSTERTGTLPRERSFEVSIDRIVVVAFDEKDAARWSRLIPDPRLVRAEAGKTTEMQSENLYRPKVEFTIYCPADSVLKQLRLYRLLWNGREFQLELVGALWLQ